SFSTVVMNSVLVGLLVSLVSDLPQMNWYMFSMDYTFANILDHLVSFTLLGILFGKLGVFSATPEVKK
ncbi:MAG: hypothetical protein KTR30_26900, partial [Saprospiraceae bacterium]|nr:hypothetical protein [Saprospiraceae bacterium]